MQCVVESVFIPNFSRKVSRPLFASRVSAGFPSPAENYIEGRIDLNKDLILHQLSTFYIRVIGDSMEPLIFGGELLIVDKMCNTKDKDVIVARLGNDLCVKRLRMLPDGSIWLSSDNPNYRRELREWTHKGLKQIFRDGFLYKNIGVILQELHYESEETIRLHGEGGYIKDKRLMAAMDKITQKFGRDCVRFGVEKHREQWEMKRELISPRYTTRLDEVIKIH